MTSEFDEYIHEDEQPRRWKVPLTWSALLVAGWLLYEATALPAVGVVTVCAKFGWNDWRAAFWLRRVDPDRRRGRACFQLYLASGLWKTALMATLLMFALAMVSAKPQPNAGPPAAFVGALLTALVCFGLTTVATCLAIFLGLRHRIKFWLDPAVHTARALKRWPPLDSYSARKNSAGRLLLTTLIVVVFPIFLTGLVVLFSMMLPQPAQRGPNQELWRPALTACIFLAFMIGMPVLLLATIDLMKKRLFAARPEECWGTVPLSEYAVLEENAHQMTEAP